ncbi:hypothetical protein E2553_00145 [Paraburkholderia dipogonis]|uniref:Uncharacterized protein n=1 Tax=Paraburkholderia dipogonis TaxID=1211383 RepID=A0A4Y8N1B4_9BURK|nr:hypothetical protein [Paraburkholderia dipogonis]TFE43580.1 hypothetical protein E2553_00145 [Paraburkholderia dipogonis]
MSKSVNLASLPKDQALALARAGGRTILGDIDAVAAVYPELLKSWTARNIPNAICQSDEEFDGLLQEIENEFNGGVDEAVAAAHSAEKSRAIIERIDKLLTDQTAIAFKLQGLVAFMVAALPDDGRGELPVKCTLMHLQVDMMDLAERLMDIVSEAENGAN